MSQYIFTSREAVETLLAGKPSRKQLICRANTLQRLAEDCMRFFPLPSLHASLLADAKRCRERAKE
jgi:hypothetical protein